MSFNVPGDLQLSADGRTLLLKEGEDQLRQAIEVGLKIFRGQWIYDPAAGVPYLQTVFVKGTPLEVIRQAFRSQVIKIPGVVDIPEMSVQFEKTENTLRVDMLISGENGITVDLSTNFGVS